MKLQVDPMTLGRIVDVLKTYGALNIHLEMDMITGDWDISAKGFDEPSMMLVTSLEYLGARRIKP